VQNYIGALYWYLQAASNSDTRAINNVALMYYNAEGMEKDERQCTLWLEAGARRGNKNCKTNLAIILTKPSDHGNRDYDSAVKLFGEVMKDTADLLAINNLACCYVRGFGVEIDYNKAKKLFKKANERGCLVAKYNLGVLYHNGLGVRQNSKTAQKYFTEVENNKKHPEYRCLEAISHDPTKFVFFTTMVSYTHASDIDE